MFGPDFLPDFASQNMSLQPDFSTGIFNRNLTVQPDFLTGFSDRIFEKHKTPHWKGGQ
jgi:hypothetical protein